MRKLTVVLLLSSVASFADAATYDLSADWSDSNNPNGPWSYLVGSGVASSGGLRTGDNFQSPPGAPLIWGSAYLGWSKDNGSADYFLDLKPGDIYGHTGPISIDWTSPVTGMIDVSGTTWQLRNIGRTNSWSLDLAATNLASGTIASGDGHSRANPQSFSFSGLAVTAGEVLSFSASPPSTGDYLGVSLSVTTHNPAPVPVPAALWLLAPLMPGLGMLRKGDRFIF